jgi:HEPN domain-containing protein
MSDKDLTPYIIDLARRSFRDIADQDYIAARTCYRVKLFHNFLWNGLQAIEKYLKGILLFNKIDSRKLRHDIVSALELAKEIKDINFNVPSDAEDFIKYLNDYGEDRYLVQPYYLRENALHDLDRSVWYIRRYCYYLRGEKIAISGKTINLLEIEVRKIHHPKYEKYPHKFSIFGGYLEDMLRKNEPATANLIWNNLYFGRRKRHRIRNFPDRIEFKKPTLFVHPEVFPGLEKLVYLNKDIRDHFKYRALSPKKAKRKKE